MNAKKKSKSNSLVVLKPDRWYMVSFGQLVYTCRVRSREFEPWTLDQSMFVRLNISFDLMWFWLLNVHASCRHTNIIKNRYQFYHLKCMLSHRPSMWLMDLVEEFLELGRQVAWMNLNISWLHVSQTVFFDNLSTNFVSWFSPEHVKPRLVMNWDWLVTTQVSVSTLVKLLEVIQRRFPRRLLPKLVSIKFWEMKIESGKRLYCQCWLGRTYGTSFTHNLIVGAMGHEIFGIGFNGNPGGTCSPRPLSAMLIFNRCMLYYIVRIMSELDFPLYIHTPCVAYRSQGKDCAWRQIP